MAQPKSARETLQPTPTQVGALTLQPLGLDQYLFLDKIGSPFVDAKALGRSVRAMDVFKALYALVHPTDACLAVWAQGAEAYDAAVIVWSQSIVRADIEALAATLIDHVGAGLAPYAKTVAKDFGEDGPSPLAGGAPSPTTTDSAGS